jgi:ubiquinone biosynthesis protein
MVMQDGLFHGDLHPGNLFVLPDGRIGLIDFGIVGRLSRRIQDSIMVMFTSIVDEDFDTLAAEYCNVCNPTESIDLPHLQKDLMDSISPYMGMALGEVNVGQILLKSTRIATQHQLQVPRELMLLFRAILTIESLGKKLDPTYDLLPVGIRLARQTLASRYSKERMTRDLLVIGRDVHSLLETSPRLLRRFLRKWSQNNFSIETRSADTQKLSQSIQQLNRSSLVIVSSLCFFVLGVFFLRYPRGPELFEVPVATIGLFFLTWFPLVVRIRRLKGL